jgi:hypothetical protein
MPKKIQQRKEEAKQHTAQAVPPSSPAKPVARSYSEVSQQYRMQGKKVSITDLIKMDQPVLAKSYVMRPSKFSNSNYMTIQLEINTKPCYTETASVSVVEKIQRVKDHLPMYLKFSTKLGKAGRTYETVE